MTKPEPPQRTWTPRPVDRGAQLDDIPTVEYVHALTGEEIHERRKSRCPLPDHDDRSPSFRVINDTGFNCFGCNRGGRIFDFAAALWGYGPATLRGDTFCEIRDRLLDELGIR